MPQSTTKRARLLGKNPAPLALVDRIHALYEERRALYEELRDLLYVQYSRTIGPRERLALVENAIESLWQKRRREIAERHGVSLLDRPPREGTRR